MVQATYDQVKAALREASENPTLGKFIGYTEDQVRMLFTRDIKIN